MAKIVKRRIWWDHPVDVPDLAGYRVYIALAPVTFGYDLSNIETGPDRLEVIAPDDFPAGTFDQEGDYFIWITAFDEVGNESDPLALSARFDFIPPPAPLNGGIETL